jgi:hypothetical protein
MDGHVDMLWSTEEEWYDPNNIYNGPDPAPLTKCPTPNEDL